MGFYLNHNNWRHIYYKHPNHIGGTIFFKIGDGETIDDYIPVVRLQSFEMLSKKFDTKFERGQFQTIKTIFEPEKMREYKMNIRVYSGRRNNYGSNKRYIINVKEEATDTKYKHWSVLNIIEYWRNKFIQELHMRHPGKLYYITKNLQGEKINNYLEGYFTEMNILKTDPLGDWADVEMVFLDINGGWVKVVGELNIYEYDARNGIKVADVKKELPVKYDIHLYPRTTNSYFSFGFNDSSYPYTVEISDDVYIEQSWGFFEADSKVLKNTVNIFEPLIPTTNEIYFKTNVDSGRLTLYQYTPWPMVASDVITIGG